MKISNLQQFRDITAVMLNSVYTLFEQLRGKKTDLQAMKMVLEN